MATALTWPVAVALTSWDYMWRITVMHRSETTGSDPAGHLPPAVPDEVAHDEIAGIDTGSGPIYHRRYSVAIHDSPMNERQLFATLCENLQSAVPGRLARFRKVLGTEGTVLAGDEYLVRMPGPWDGPVRVIDRQPCSFRLGTLTGHLEAGQIEFSVRDEDGDMVFAIESWTRSGDWVANLLYHHLRLAKEVQAHMWISFLENVAAIAHGRTPDGVIITTHRVLSG